MPPPVPDLRRIEHFVAVADAGGFTRAAETLHVSQQALSSSIHQLEKNLGATLFERAGRKVTLTRAGHALLGEGRALLAAARTMGEHVRRVASDSSEEFVVGHTPALSGVEVYSLLERAIDASPAVSFTLRQLYPGDLTAAVLSGEIHLGLRRGVAPPHELAAAIIGYHPVRVAVPGGHRLASRRRVDLEELAGETVALWAPPGSSYYSDLLVGACRRAGFEPDYVVSRVQGAAPVAAPLTTGAIAFLTTAPGPAFDGRVVVLDVHPVIRVPVQALWQRHTTSAVREYILSG